MAAIKRPFLHFTPPKGWINDPNGTMFHDGQYHLFYQHYPDDVVWGPMHWGHAVSRDLLMWEHCPIALYPDEVGMCFSGSAVVDEANTSGFGAPGETPLVAAYTSHRDDVGERQSLAHSVDGGLTWHKYQGNPVLAETAFRDFRDPRVFWHAPTQSWVMVVASGDRTRLYRSPNLREWAFASEFGPVTALGDAVWECPDLFPLPWGDGQKWLFTLSVTSGGPVGKQGVKYFVGDFDGYGYTPLGEPRLADWGLDFYAPITFQGVEGRTVWIGWLNSWVYATATPAEGWRGMMSLPRELALVEGPDGPMLTQQTCGELDGLRRTTLLVRAGEAAADTRQLHCDDMGHVAVLQGEATGAGQWTLTLCDALRLTVDTAAMTATVERLAGRNACEHPVFPQTLAAPLVPGVPVGLRIVIDHNAVEISLQEGRVLLSALCYPVEENHSMTAELTGECTLDNFVLNQLG